MAKEKTVRLPQMARDAQVRAQSFDADANTIEIVWATESPVRRFDWWDGSEYDEVLSCEPAAVRLERLNRGAPFLDSHNSYCLDNVIGSVVPGSAKIDDARGTASILLSKAPGVANTVQKIAEGVIRNVSVGYWLHKVVKTEAADGTVARWDVTDWEPLEISAVPIPADAQSQVRSEPKSTKDGPKTRSCLLVTKPAAPGPKSKARSAKGDKMPKIDQSATEEQKRRLAALRAMDDDTPKDKDEDERDEDDADDERDAEEPEDKDKDGDADDSRDADDGDKEDHEDKDEDAEKDDKRSAAELAKREADKAVRAERARISEIGEIAAQFSLPNLGRQHVGKGTSVRAFKDLVLKRLAERQAKRGDASLSVAATTKDTAKGGKADRAQPDNVAQRAFDDAAETARKLLGKK